MTVLQAGADAPAWVHAAADAILYLHIGGGSLGMVAGATAMFARKGEFLHIWAGRVFFVGMLVMAGIGASVAPFLDDGQRPNTVAGVLTFYLVASGWAAVRRQEIVAGRFEVAGFVVAFLSLAAGVVFMLQAANDPSGTVDGSPPQAFIFFVTVGGFAAASDLKVILLGRISGAPRIARHLWRMCTGTFIAAGSFFLGQQQMLPEYVRGTVFQFAPVFLPLLVMVFWLVRVRLTRWYDRAPDPNAESFSQPIPSSASGSRPIPSAKARTRS
jgi:hypothetical protein